MKKLPSSNNPNIMLDAQSFMAQAIMRPLTEDSISSKWIDGSSMSVCANKFIKANSKMSAIERLEIYNQQYWYRVLDSLKEDFPGLLAFLGDAYFTALAIDYLMQYPSKSYSLRDLGNKLPEYIAGNTCGLKTVRHRIAAEMVNFEWSEIQAFDAAKREPIDPQNLGKSESSNIKISLQPYIFILSLDYAIDDFLIQQKKPSHYKDIVTAANSLPRKSQAIGHRPKREKNFTVIHRIKNSIYYKRISQTEYVLLSALRSGAPLMEACSLAFNNVKTSPADVNAFANDIGESFALWSSLGWFCAA
jgi:hypothetical protein